MMSARSHYFSPSSQLPCTIANSASDSENAATPTSPYYQRRTYSPIGPSKSPIGVASPRLTVEEREEEVIMRRRRSIVVLSKDIIYCSLRQVDKH